MTVNVFSQWGLNRIIRYQMLDSILTYRGIPDSETFYGQIIELLADVDSLYTKTSHIVNVDEFIAGHDTTQGWQDILNEATQYCITNSATLYLPARRYMIKDTWWIGKPSAFTSVSIVGSIGYAGYKGTTIYADFVDRPAINIQGARMTTISGLDVVGKNIDKVTEAIWTKKMPNDESAYIDDDMTSGRYNPYAGITIDGYTTPQPDSQYYTNHAYNGAPSFAVTIRDVNIFGFVVGVALSPSANNSNNDNCVLDRVSATFCTYAFSSSGTQNRSFVLSGCNAGANYINVITNRFGAQLGIPPKIVGGLYGLCYKMFNFVNAGGDAISISGIYAESMKQIGYLGEVGEVTGSSFYFSVDASYGNNDAIALITRGVAFNGCVFGMQEDGVINFEGYNATFNNCKFSTLWDDIFYVGRGYYYNNPIFNFNNSYGFSQHSGGWSDGQGVILSDKIKAATLPSRVEYTPLASLYQTHDSSYTIYSGASYGLEPVASNSATWVDDTLNIEVAVGEVLAGDIMYWQTSLYGVYQYIKPMLKVESVIGTSAKASKLFDSTNYNYSYDPTYIFIAQREWATNVNLTGNITAGSDTIVNLSDTTVIQAGDFVKGVGLPTTTRVISVNADTIIISKEATLTTSNTALYYGKLKNIRQDISDLSGLENIIDYVETSIPLDSAGLLSDRLWANPETGLINYIFAENLVINGDFSDWTLGEPDDWLITAGFADPGNSYEESPTGKLHIVTDGDENCRIYQMGADVGVTYNYSFTISNFSGDTVYIGGGSGALFVSADGYYSGEHTATEGTMFAILSIYKNSDFIIDNIKVWVKNGTEKQTIYTPHESPINLLNPTTSDSIFINLIESGGFTDSMKVFDILDSVAIQLFYRVDGDGDYNLITTVDTLTSATTIAFDVTTIPAGARVYMYPVFIGDSEAYIRTKLYWRD